MKILGIDRMKGYANEDIVYRIEAQKEEIEAKEESEHVDLQTKKPDNHATKIYV